MGTCNIPLEAAIKDIITSTATSNQKIQALSDAIRECNEAEMIEQLKKMNMYFAIITGCKL